VLFTLAGCFSGGGGGGDNGSDSQAEEYELTLVILGDGEGIVFTTPEGIECGVTCDAMFQANASIAITAAPTPDSKLIGWDGGGCDQTENLNQAQDTCLLDLKKDTEVVVIFESAVNLSTLTVNKQGSGDGTVNSVPSGIACGSDCLENYQKNTPVTLTATPDENSNFIGWLGACAGTGACQLNMAADTQVIADFAAKITYNLNVTRLSCGYGRVRSTPAGIDCSTTCDQRFENGTAVTLVAQADPGSTFEGWGGACAGVGNCVVNMTADTNVTAEFSEPTDPLFDDQWHLRNTGQSGGTIGEDINVQTVWQLGTLGTGIRIAVVDDGLDIVHEDLVDNVVAGRSHNYVDGGNDPTGPVGPPPSKIGAHGTSVAGLAAAREENNCLGGRGVAPRAELVGYNIFLANGSLVPDHADAMTRGLADNDISNNSWGMPDGWGILYRAPNDWKAAINTGVTDGRDGSGIIYIWAAGNGGAGEDNANYDGNANHHQVIAVGAVTHEGTTTSYSEPGANIWISAPGGEPDIDHGLTTTDRIGNDGYNPDVGRPFADYDDFNYTNSMGMTSGAAPQVAGVVALMLETNDELSWRDVRLILAETARQNDAGNADWLETTAPYHFHHQYGFGVVDASAAVERARNWVNVGELRTHTVAEGAVGLRIPDNNAAGISHTLEVVNSCIDDIEWVEITFSATDHAYSGDLDIILTSPIGAQSILAEQRSCHDPDPTIPPPPVEVTCNDYDEWIFGSARHLGESADGEWQLTVIDRTGAHGTGTFESWQLRIFGTGECALAYARANLDLRLNTEYTVVEPSGTTTESRDEDGWVYKYPRGGLAADNLSWDGGWDNSVDTDYYYPGTYTGAFNINFSGTDLATINDFELNAFWTTTSSLHDVTETSTVTIEGTNLQRTGEASYTLIGEEVCDHITGLTDVYERRGSANGIDLDRTDTLTYPPTCDANSRLIIWLEN
jgi:kexin